MLDDQYLDKDPGPIWQAQIVGVIDYDDSSCNGALTDLQGDPAWRDTFKDIASLSNGGTVGSR